jgi:pyrroline-5-carboxylate reductase
MLNKKIAIIGTGQMGGALIEGLVTSGTSLRRNIMAADKDKTRLNRFAKKGIKITTDNLAAVKWADVIILSVKPQHLNEVLEEIRIVPSGFKLFISIAAGIKTKTIENRLGKVRVIRAMPNIPALIGEGMTVVSPGRFISPGDTKAALDILESVGEVMIMPEVKMDAVTALSGSGPAYFFYLMEALIGAGKRFGISDKDSLNLILQTAYGAAALAKKGNYTPDKLREMVTSKGGTTEAALKILKRYRTKDAIIKALASARRRAAELC